MPNDDETNALLREILNQLAEQNRMSKEYTAKALERIEKQRNAARWNTTIVAVWLTGVIILAVWFANATR